MQIKAYDLLYKNMRAYKAPKNGKNVPKIADIGTFLPF